MENSLDLNEINIQKFTGVGEKVAIKLAKLNIYTAQDVLFHLPHRYEDRTQYSDIRSLAPNSSALVRGEIIDVVQIPVGRRSLVIQIHDGTSRLTIRLFHYSYTQKQAFVAGRWVECFGEVVLRPTGKEMVHPEYRIVTDKPETPQTDRLTPVYPATEGVSQHLLRKLVDQALKKYMQQVADLLPEQLLDKYQFCSLVTALHELHQPSKGQDIQSMLEADSPYFKRLIFEELLAFNLAMQKVRAERRLQKAIALSGNNNNLISAFLKSLPFELTNAQERTADELVKDLQKQQPMMRLVQGDVGSGKTVVAAIAALQAIDSGVQVAVMAPTELLAEQLLRNFTAWFEPLGIEVGWLAGKLTEAKRRPVLSTLLSGELSIVVGTHALFQKGVEFDRLGLVIIDEQHRFGVEQRLALRSKSEDTVAHQLIMSATPIPRTLAMSIYADIDVSTIDELPKGRQPVETVVVNADMKRDLVIERVYKACLDGKQVYWVCSLIEESEVLRAEALTDVEQEFISQFHDIRVGVVHGRMKPKEKESIMQQFRDQEIDLLIATTVIEVGVDVPNASLMIIENAERMGLSQLHQLRGRVGRGNQKSICVLMYRAPLSENAKIRLQTMRETNDGFEIARKDLELRGPGELLGMRQTGAVTMRIANLIRDQHWLAVADEEANVIQSQSPDTAEALLNRWVAHQQEYANA